MSNSKNVYDILNAGPRNRFTIITDDGPLVVHNCAGAGGEDALQTFCNVYRLHMTGAEKARAVKLFRAARPSLNAFWVTMDVALAVALDPVNPQVATLMVGPNQTIPMEFKQQEDKSLHIKLPSGRPLVYRDAAMREIEGAWYPTYIDTEDRIVTLSRAILSIQFVQAAARDLFAEIMVNMYNEGWSMIHHVHDEMIFEVPEAKADECLNRLQHHMRTAPTWLPGLPVEGVGDVSDFWHK